MVIKSCMMVLILAVFHEAISADDKLVIDNNSSIIKEHYYFTLLNDLVIPIPRCFVLEKNIFRESYSKMLYRPAKLSIKNINIPDCEKNISGVVGIWIHYNYEIDPDEVLSFKDKEVYDFTKYHVYKFSNSSKFGSIDEAIYILDANKNNQVIIVGNELDSYYRDVLKMLTIE